MGLFSSKTRIDVDVVTNPLVDENDHQNFLKNAILKGTIGGQGVSNTLVNDSINGYSRSVDKFYRVYKRSDNLQLPRGQGFTLTLDEAEVKALIEQVEGESVSITMLNYSSNSAYFYAQMMIQKSHGLDIETGEILSNYDDDADAKYFFKDAEYIVEYDGVHIVRALEQIKITYDKVTKDIDNNDVVETKSKNIPYLFKQSDRAFIVSYYHLVSDIEETTKIFMRAIDADLYSVGNQGTFSRLDSYYPITSIKRGGDIINTTAPAEVKEDIDKALSAIGLSLGELTDAITTTENDNDADQMHDVFLTFSANLFSENKYTIEYLHEYFKDLSHTQLGSKENYDLWWNNGNPLSRAPKQTRLRILQDNFDVNLTFNYITVETLTGSMSDKVESEFIVHPPHKTEIVMPYNKNITIFEIERSVAIFRKRISATEYEEVTVHGLMHIHEVYENHVALRTIATGSKEDKDFFLPLARNIVKKVPGLGKNYVLQDCICVTVYAVQKTKVKWYERGIFKWVLAVIAIIYAIFSYDWATASSVISGLIAIATNLLISVAVGAAIGYLLKPVLIELIDMLGMENSMLLMVVIMAVALYFQVDLISIGADVAVSMVDVAFNFVDAFTAYVQESFLNLMEEAEVLLSTMKEFEDEMDAINDLLGSGSGFDYLMVSSQNKKNFLETPSIFFTRTLNKNPGIMVLDSVTNFVEMKLQLPKYQNAS